MELPEPAVGKVGDLEEAGETGLCRRSPPVSVAAVLPAGGSGERLGGSTPKQFCLMLGRPLISYTVQAIERINWISDVVVVVSSENIEIMKSIIRKYGHERTTVVEGGLTRHRSIFNGLKVFVKGNTFCAPFHKPEIIVIHDAVRPFVEEDILFKVVMAAKEHGAAGAIRPLVSTVIASTTDGCLDHSLDRAKYRASEMPQAFLFDKIHQAYLQCSDYDLDYGTECLHLALKYSKINAKLIEGSPDLWKVTYKWDLFAADCLIKDTISQEVCIITDIKEDAVQVGFLLNEKMKNHVKHVQNEAITLHKNDNLQNILLRQCYNFIYINNKQHGLEEISLLVDKIENTCALVLYPVVLILVNMGTLENTSFNTGIESLTILAKEVKKKNILLYGLFIQYKKESLKLQETMDSAAALITILIRERNPAFVGQLLVA
ncbi:D-ribitol-5-phosphate cytidylyltransferase [Crotalus tigris]|uniref:D-ribitol-5-phosphate cytidylyltransferase n=1 Tax=Crotalus tigris TaxID=88082 RepID=UPI00192F79DC|nr:D-ribitol-5-phosphate cytidylyltransferase [Crotalus tigris]